MVGSLSIFLHVILAAYVAYRTDEWTENIAETASQLNQKLNDEFGGTSGIVAMNIASIDGTDAADAGVEAVGNVAADAFKSLSAKIAPKIGEGIANGLMTHRIGTYTWNVLKPVAIVGV